MPTTGLAGLFVSSLITFFVVIDPPGCAPIYAGLTAGAPRAHVRAMAIRAVFVAAAILFVFALFIGAYLVLLVGLFAVGVHSPLAIIPHLVLPLVIVYLPMVAVYAAQRYRLTRTLWRGIRGGMSGSAWTYGLRAVGYNLIAAITLGLATP